MLSSLVVALVLAQQQNSKTGTDSGCQCRPIMLHLTVWLTPPHLSCLIGRFLWPPLWSSAMDLLPASSCRASLCSPGYCLEYNLCSFCRETCGPGQWPSGIYVAGGAGSGARRPVFCTLLDAGGQSLILCGQGLHPRAPQKCPFSGPVWLLSHCHQTGLMRSSDTTWQLLGPVGTGMGAGEGGETKTKHAFLLLHQLPASHLPCILGMTLCPKAHLNEKKVVRLAENHVNKPTEDKALASLWEREPEAWSWYQVGLGDSRRPYWR